jgi:type I restriction enzyme R subunit
MKEAKARIKINRLLEDAGWRFFDEGNKLANIALEANAKLKQIDIDAFGENFETIKNGFVDFLLLDERGFPFVILEAKKENKNPLDGKEQARRYAQSQNVRFVILSNGNLHYLWDIEHGNPEIITQFPTLQSLQYKTAFTPNNKRLIDEIVIGNYIALSQKPSYIEDPKFKNELTRKDYITENGLRFLRPYQVQAIKALQFEANQGRTRFLFEMATGTGKTLTSAAVIKLFLRTGNAKRVLFLVDRLELENQADKNFVRLLKNDYTTAIYKQNRDDWAKAEIVVTTVQSLAINDKYLKHFKPSDFDLIISDEAHRSISGNSRAVFEYFNGFKLGLTATPKDYLKNAVKNADDQREWERRILLDTYKTFGCENGEPTFRYSLLDGVRDDFLVNPVTVDARTEITTKLLSEKGFSVHQPSDDAEDTNEASETFFGKDFEKKFFNEATNLAFCQTFMQSALKDPLSGEIGKTIVFCVSQKHASKVTQILNELAHELYPSKYNSDFAVQVTSNVADAQTMTINFANNNLNGYTKFLEGYKSSKTRICVTVGMMTTGYDCEDILNLGLMRPVFSPADFVQIKGRGTRKHTFSYADAQKNHHFVEKERFKLFDFFANCEYFEEKFNYDEVLQLPKIIGSGAGGGEGEVIKTIDLGLSDEMTKVVELLIGDEGMKIDRQLFQQAKETLSADMDIKQAVENGQWEIAENTLREKYEDKPNLYLTLDKIRASENLDRRLSWREVLERVFGLIDRFQTKDEKLNDEIEKFITLHQPNNENLPNIRNYMKTYILDEQFRTIINAKEYAELNAYAGFGIQEFKTLGNYRDQIPEYIKNYVSLNQFMN